MGFLARRTLLTAAPLSLVACSGSGQQQDSPEGDAPPVSSKAFETTVLPVDASAFSLSELLLESATTVMVASQEKLGKAASVAVQHKLPLFPDVPELLPELDRLGVKAVLPFDGDRPEVGDRDLLKEAPEPSSTPPTDEAVAIHLEGEKPSPVAEAMLTAAGIAAKSVTHVDPRATSESVAAVRDASSVLALGAFGDAQRLANRVDMARTATELPGGGVAPLPHNLMVALYGHPSGGTLGLLGEQGPEESVARVQELVAEYQPLTDRQVTPAFEIITTVASAHAGKDRDYSFETPADELLPLIDAAEEAGIYCVLDLQPGHTDFLTQAKLYEELLLKPHVGLALDPEWRLKPGWKHMKQIGQVDIDEVNETGAWLADLVRDNKLPAKILILHQFQTRMIVDRDKLDTSRDEIQYLVHVDGNGSHGDKLATWNTLKDVPDGVFLGWKNFIDEDAPMMTPEETMEYVAPTPDFVSYQ